MFKVLCDGALICDSRVEELALINPVVNLEENKAGSFSFIFPPEHQHYDTVQKRKSEVQVFRDEELIFSGTCIEVTTDFFKQKKISCEGELTYFNDSIQRPTRYQNKTVRGLLEAFINAHNEQVEAKKQFHVGMVTVEDSNDSISCYTNYESTMQCLKEDLVDDLGGFFRIRHVDGVKYIDYLSESPNTNSQSIKIGKNLLDFTTNMDASDIATAIIPLGCRLEETHVEGLETRLNIESVNNGIDYVHSAEAVANYGWIYRTVEFDDVTVAENLKSKGEKYLADVQFESMVIEAKAIDLHLTNKEMEAFKLSDNIRVISAPHGLNRYFRLTKQQINLNKPESDSITLGKTVKASLSAKTAEAKRSVQKAENTLLQQAVANASSLIANAMGGYVVKTNDEILIMDTDNIATAQKVWRWNINGLGYSSTGYNGEYALAMTMDGQFVADFITTGTLNADRIRAGSLCDKSGNNSFNLETGLLTITNGNIDVFAGSGTSKVTVRSDTYISKLTDDGVVVERPDWSAKTLHNANGVFILDSEEAIVGSFRYSAGGSQLSVTGEIASSFDNLLVYNSFAATGTKSRVAKTENYNQRLLYCYETPTPMFGDIGEGTLDENGKCVVFLDDVFAETIDTDCQYQVFLQPYGKGECYVSERNAMYFVVEGAENLSFGWEVKAIQKGFDTLRMAEHEGRTEMEDVTLSSTYAYLQTLLYDTESEEV